MLAHGETKREAEPDVKQLSKHKNVAAHVAAKDPGGGGA